MWRVNLILFLSASLAFGATKVREGAQTEGALPTAQGGAPAGGTTGKALIKQSNADYDYDWATVIGGVSSVFTRTGAVVAQTGDYTAAQVTNAVDTTSSYSNPVWITALIWSKITSTPTTLSGYGITDAVPNTRTVSTTAPISGGGALSSNLTLSMHVADATHDGYLSSTDWNTFSAGGGGTPGGSNTQVQYNNSGAFGGITNATSDGTTITLTSPKVVTNLLDTNGNVILGLTATSSAVNYLTDTNAVTGDAMPALSVDGSDSNISLSLRPKGNAFLRVGPDTYGLSGWSGSDLGIELVQFTAPTSSSLAFYIENGGGDFNNADVTGIDSIAYTSSGGTNNQRQVAAGVFSADSNLPIGKTLTRLRGSITECFNLAAGSVTDARGLEAIVGIQSGPATNAIGVSSELNLRQPVTTAEFFYGRVNNAFWVNPTNLVGYFQDDISSLATNPYFIYYNSPGVYTVDGNGQPSYYNPSFTQYTGGATDYERLTEKWNSNVAEIGTEASGTGTLRPLRLIGSSIKLNPLTSNGFVKTSGGDGTLSVDTSTYLTSSSIDDTAYNATTWDGDTTHAPSKNAIRDKIESMSSATGANPTASVGLSAVNGSASTFLRSDGAPALDQSIAPTWTGQHNFKLTDSATGTTATPVTISHSSSSTPSTNFGTTLQFKAKDSTTDDISIGKLDWSWSTATHAVRESRLTVSMCRSGASDQSILMIQNGGMSLDASGSPNLPVADQIDVKGGFTISGGATNGKLLQGNGTRFQSSTPTWPTTAGSSGGVVLSDGSNLVTEVPVVTAVSKNLGGWKEYYVTGSNVTRTAQTLADITGLVSDTLSISSTYEFEASMMVASSSSTGNQYGVNVTVAPTRIVATSAATTSATAATIVSTAANNTAMTAQMTVAADGYVNIKGYFTTAGSGSPVFSIQHLKVTSGTSTVYIGSTLRIRKK